MLKPKEVEAYTGTLNEVVSDLIGRLEHQRNLHEDHVVKDVAGEFYKFGLEGMCWDRAKLGRLLIVRWV